MLRKQDYEMMFKIVEKVLDKPMKRSEIIKVADMNLLNEIYHSRVETMWKLEDFERFTRVLNRFVNYGWLKKEGMRYVKE